jgi:hypothetical protein
MNPWVPPTVAQFQAQFFRDFPYAPADDTVTLDYVQPQDIQNAINEANAQFNPGLFGPNATMIFMYLAAHCLCINLQNSAMGIGAQAIFANSSAAVGSVSFTNNIDNTYLGQPLFAGFLTTGYGKRYLDFAYPYTIGHVSVAEGTVGSP